MSTEAPGDTRKPDSPEDGATPPDQQATGSIGRIHLILPVIVIVVLVGGVALLIAGGSSTKQQLPGGASSAHVSSFDGSLLSPVRAAPPLSSLHNYQGQPISLADYRGKAVFVTFLYTHCPEVCPLIASQLHNAVTQLGPRASHVQLIAVSVDPRGDKPPAVATFLREHQLTGQMQYLIGSAAELAPVWKTWGVGSNRDVGNPEFINHSALIYGISASGKLTTIYPASFNPTEIVHDVPGLLSS
ncbi:MAG: SCO family protein [Solirubrobacteraceae bacterium]